MAQGVEKGLVKVASGFWGWELPTLAVIQPGSGNGWVLLALQEAVKRGYKMKVEAPT